MSLAALQAKKKSLIRKALSGSVFVADESATTIDESTLFDATTGDLVAPLPTGFADLGEMTTDGAQFARSVTTSDISSWGSNEPSRSDVTADTTTMQGTFQETNIRTLGMWLGIDKATLDAAGANGVIRIDVPENPAPKYSRLLMIAADQTDAGEIVICRYMPRAKITSYDNQVFNNADAALQYPVTFTGYKDDTLGFAHSWIFGGAGWLALLADMGFTAPAS